MTLVEPNENGILLETRDPSDWADAIEDVLTPTNSRHMAQASATMARRYTWRHTADAISDLVDRLRSGALLLCP